MSQKPTVCRIVHFYEDGDDKRPLAALIVFVSTIESTAGVPLINLAVWGPDGMSGIEEGVAYSEEPKPGCWSWPPRT